MKRMEYALTGNTDVDMQILLDVDKLTLDKSCNVNKYIRSICDNENFWRMKFMHDKFPVLTTNIVNYKREYNKVWELRNKAKNIHLINEIERSRKEDETFGSIVIELTSKDDVNLLPLSDDFLNEISAILATGRRFNFTTQKIVIEPDRTFYELLDQFENAFASASANFNYEQKIVILTAALYNNLIIKDDEHLNFILSGKPPDTLDAYSLPYFYKRVALWDMIEYLKSHPNVNC